MDFAIDAGRVGTSVTADVLRDLTPEVRIVGHQLKDPLHPMPVSRALGQSLKSLRRFSGQHWLSSVQAFFLELLTVLLPPQAAVFPAIARQLCRDCVRPKSRLRRELFRHVE